MRKKLVIVILAMFVLFSFFTGCTKNSYPASENKNTSQSIKGDPLTVISDAVKNLRNSTNFDAQKTVTIKINGKETRAVIFNFITNSSSVYMVSKTELKNGQSRTIFKRVHLKKVQYELDSSNNQWNLLSSDKNPSMFMYSYYKINRSLVLDIVDEIYSVDKNKFGNFVENAKKSGTETVNGNMSTVYSYSYSGEDDKRTINRNGKIYVAEINGKPFIVKVIDDNLTTFKSSGTTVENITDLEIKNIGNATRVSQEK
jgi:hypothetical protein